MSTAISVAPRRFLSRFEDEEIRIVGQNAEEDRADHAIDVHGIVMLVDGRGLTERVCNHHGPFFAIISMEDDKMAGRLSPDVIVPSLMSHLTAASIEIGGTEARDDGNAPIQVFPDEGRGEILEADFSAGLEKGKVSLGSLPQLGACFVPHLLPQFVRDPMGWVCKPGGVEDPEVVRIHTGGEAVLEGMTAEEYRQSAPLFEGINLRD